MQFATNEPAQQGPSRGAEPGHWTGDHNTGADAAGMHVSYPNPCQASEAIAHNGRTDIHHVTTVFAKDLLDELALKSTRVLDEWHKSAHDEVEWLHAAIQSERAKAQELDHRIAVLRTALSSM